MSQFWEALSWPQAFLLVGVTLILWGWQPVRVTITNHSTRGESE